MPEKRSGFERDLEKRASRDQRRELAAFLRQRGAKISNLWQDRADADSSFPDPCVVCREECEPDTIVPSLAALIEHLEADGPDIDMQAHRQWLECWLEADLDSKDAGEHFHALHDLCLDELQDTDEIHPEEKAPMAGLLQAAIRNLRLETSEVEAQRLLARTREVTDQFQLLFTVASEAIIVAERETGRIHAANPNAALLLGTTRETLENGILGDLHPALAEVINVQTAEQDPQSRKITIKNPEGNQLVLQVLSAHLSFGHIPMIQVMIRDVTEQERFNDALEQRAEELQTELSGQLANVESLTNFLENIIDALPTRLLVLDENLKVLHVNTAYLQQRRLEKNTLRLPDPHLFQQKYRIYRCLS